MGLFFNSEKKKQEQQRAAEWQAKTERLSELFEAGIRSIAPIYPEVTALDLAVQCNLKDYASSFQELLVTDLAIVAATISAATGDPNCKGTGLVAAQLAGQILTKAAPEGLPDIHDVLPNLPRGMGKEAENQAWLIAFPMLCRKGNEDGSVSNGEFVHPVSLTVLTEYDETNGTSYTPTIANLFAGFVEQLKDAPALRGSAILDTYISSLHEYTSASKSGAEQVAARRALE